jgi:hypothetical protein
MNMSITFFYLENYNMAIVVLLQIMSAKCVITDFVNYKLHLHLAPAGGVAAAAPERGALAGPSASPHLPVVGAGKPVAVPGLAR